MKYFDFEKVALEAKISKDELAKLEKIMRREFPGDEMMYELHMVRACIAVKNKYGTIDEMLRIENIPVDSDPIFNTNQKKKLMQKAI